QGNHSRHPDTCCRARFRSRGGESWLSSDARDALEVGIRVAVLTTSYPRFPGDVVGRFVADAVEHVRRRGIDVEVVGPEQFKGYGLTFGHGVLGNLRRRPWLALFVPALLAGFVQAARR